ncbi:DUF979 domain-containing protein [Basilea psittacipulmonis]|uniref:Permease n=1 Tax=Basilea psittacipulmonis DSM 24701 TaxID=1072685 RepID=A0A077DGJ4_9BURK|nr:DUF979 domain-containing protein [Basilea psittacipulmonis]AIL32233.1 permease [Basilea psittacipulmonis DSM 24701]
MNALLTLDHFYILTGIILALIALFSFLDKHHPKKWGNGLFWLLLAVLYVFGDVIPSLYAGLIVIFMIVLAGCKLMGVGKYHELSEQEREAKSQTIANKIFIPALLIPFVTLILALGFSHLTLSGIPLMQSKPSSAPTLISLALACIIAAIVAYFLTKEKPTQYIHESRRILDSIGWVIILPQLLAVLGGVFSDAGVGHAVSHLITNFIDMGHPFIASAIFCLGMALFTIIMGNAFAAFPVMMAGVGIPILIGDLNANPAIICAIGMFSGYCGTLCTPMGANFNIVPVTLLNLPSEFSVIRMQIGTAIPLLIVNIFLMYFLAFTF